MLTREDLQDSFECPECGNIGSFGAVGTTDGKSNWTGRTFRAMYCEECDLRYYVQTGGGGPTPA